MKISSGVCIALGGLIGYLKYGAIGAVGTLTGRTVFFISKPVLHSCFKGNSTFDRWGKRISTVAAVGLGVLSGLYSMQFYSSYKEPSNENRFQVSRFISQLDFKKMPQFLMKKAGMVVIYTVSVLGLIILGFEIYDRLLARKEPLPEIPS